MFSERPYEKPKLAIPRLPVLQERLGVGLKLSTGAGFGIEGVGCGTQPLT